jgi:hypothetical protein
MYRLRPVGATVKIHVPAALLVVAGIDHDRACGYPGIQEPFTKCIFPKLATTRLAPADVLLKA